MKPSWIKFFLRLALGVTFLSAVADRFGIWPTGISAWGNFSAFLSYTESLLPWVPHSMIPFVGWLVTILEIVLGLFLISGIKIRLTAQLSGLLLLSFALFMSLASGIKGPLDYSVFSAAAGAFALSIIPGNQLALDSLWTKQPE